MMRTPDRLYRFEPGQRLPFDIHDPDRRRWFPHQRPQTYHRRADAEHRLRRALDSGWYPDARLYVSNDIVWTPENVDGPT